MSSSSAKITVLLADDEPVARAGIRALLTQADDIEVVGEANNGFEVKRLVKELRPRILLLDLRMPGPRPVELERWVRKKHPTTITLVLTGHGRDALLAQMMDAGVSGYMTKNVTSEVLIDRIRIAACGRTVFDPGQSKQARAWKSEVGEKWESLTKREREILIWVALGAQNRFIADKFAISAQTVKNHVSKILQKLGVDTRQHAALWVGTHFPEELEMKD